MTQLVQAKEQLKDTGFFFIRIDSLSGGYPSHSHDYVEIVIVLEGRARHLIDERAYQLRPGDVYVLRGNTTHAFENASKDFMIANVMYLPEALSLPLPLLSKLPGYQALFVLEPARRLEGEFKSMLRLSGMELRETLSKVHALQKEMEGKEPGYESMIQAKLLELLVVLSRAYSSSPAGTDGHAILRLGEAIAWLEGNCLKPLSLPALAKRAMMSERSFLRQFRKAFGSSPIEHVIKLRLKHACSLLRRGASVREAAFASGFNDSNYFSRQFKKGLGLSPKEYSQISQGAKLGSLSSPARRRNSSGSGRAARKPS